MDYRWPAVNVILAIWAWLNLGPRYKMKSTVTTIQNSSLLSQTVFSWYQITCLARIGPSVPRQSIWTVYPNIRKSLFICLAFLINWFKPLTRSSFHLLLYLIAKHILSVVMTSLAPMTSSIPALNKEAGMVRAHEVPIYAKVERIRSPPPPRPRPFSFGEASNSSYTSQNEVGSV